MQDQLPARAMIVPDIWASDKTPLTNILHTQYMWLPNLTIGDIEKSAALLTTLLHCH